VVPVVRLAVLVVPADPVVRAWARAAPVGLVR
jgi:hypothetical protein